MKLIIEIPEDTVKEIKDNALFAESIASQIKWDVTGAIVNGTPIPDNATNGELFKQIFGIYATELWAKPESEFLEWLNGRYQKGGKG